MSDIEKAKQLIHFFLLLKKEHLRKADGHEHIKYRDIMALDEVSKIQNRQDGLMKMSDISEFFHVTPAAISQMVRNYENKGWVERVVLESDRRSVYVKIKPKAIALLKEHETKSLVKIQEYIAFLGEEDSSALIRILEKTKSFTTIFPSKKER